MAIFGKSGLGNVLQTVVMGTDYMNEKKKRELQNAFVSDLSQRVMGTPDTIAQAQIANSGGQDITDAFGPQFDFKPGRAPLNVNSPDLPGLALRAQQLGVPITQLMEVLKAQQPVYDYVNGQRVVKSGMGSENNPDFITQLDKGMKPGPGGVVQNAPGYVDAAAEAAGAVTRATEGGKAAFDVITLNMPDGSTQQVPRDVAVQAILSNLGGGGAGGPGVGAGGLGRSQTPADASAAKIKADAQANAQVTLPSDLNAIDTAIENARSLQNHPSLNMRTGGWSMMPAIPGTAGAEFEAFKQQVLGEGFLNARQALKGAGQITDFEGAKAEQAIIRAKAAQTPEAFKKAVGDYIGALQRGRAIAQQKAGVPGQGLPSAPRTTGRNGSRIISVE